MTELKPCPFCGTDDYGVHLQKIDYVAVSLSRWKIMCETCGAEISEFEKPESAVENWNRRSEDESAVPVIRCKNCKHWGGDTVGTGDRIYLGECQRHMTRLKGSITGELTGENDFCSWGERKGGNGEIY